MEWVLITMIAAVLFGRRWAKQQEKLNWNDGKCERCNTNWKYSGADSQGGRGYKCSLKCNNCIWIYYPVDN